MSVFQIYDANGQPAVGGADLTFRYVGAASFTSSATGDVIVSFPGIAAGTHFAITADARSGFPLVEQDQVRVKQSVFGGGGLVYTIYVFRL